MGDYELCIDVHTDKDVLVSHFLIVRTSSVHTPPESTNIESGILQPFAEKPGSLNRSKLAMEM